MSRLAPLMAATLVAVSSWAIGDAATVGAAADGYTPLPAPQRLLDTRPGEHTADGDFAGIGKRNAGTTLQLDVAGRSGLGVPVGSVVLNLTVDQPEDAGFLTVWPCDAERPTASNLNYVAGQVVAVAALSRVAPAGTVCVYTLAATHIIIDAAGEFPAGSFEPLAAPERLADTREGERTVDGQFAGEGLRPADHTYTIHVAGRASVPEDATAVALNVTATAVGESGFLTVYPCDADRPLASNVNYEPGLTTPNLVFSRLDPDGRVCVYTLRAVHLVVDVAGALPAASFVPMPEPRRVLDTRPGETTFDRTFRGGGLQQDGATLQLPVAGRVGVPHDATAVVLNVTSTGSTTPGFVTAHPQGSELAAASSVNFAGGRTVANLVVAALGATGDVCLFTRGATHLVVDVAGWLRGPPPATATPSCPARTAPDTAETYRTTYVRRPALHRAVGHDRVAVYLCRIPADSTWFDGSQQHAATDRDFADLANAQVAPYFTEVSGGSYTVEFVANGAIQASRDDGEADCIDHALALSGGSFTNALVADSTLSGGGYASPGWIYTSDSGPDFDVFERTPLEARRGGWIGGAVISERPSPNTIVHEMGHTLHWPHSYVGPYDEYDNPIDVMSGGFGYCENGTFSYPCDPGSTMAFNRFAAGWLRNGQVIAHTTGTTNYVLDRPNAAGLQLIVAPGADEPHSALTLEARPAVGDDEFITSEGVAVHVVDQVRRSDDSFSLSGLSTSRFHRQAVGPGGGYEHVLAVGDTTTAHGLTISVLRRVGDRFELRVAGTYTPPAPSFFTQSTGTGTSSCGPSPAPRSTADVCGRPAAVDDTTLR